MKMRLLAVEPQLFFILLFILNTEFRNNKTYYKFILSGAQNVLEGSSFWDLIALLHKKQLTEA